MVSASGGHAVPTVNDPTFSQVVTFMQNTSRNGQGGGGGLIIGSVSPAVAWSKSKDKPSGSVRPPAPGVIAWVVLVTAAATKLM